MVFEKLTLNYHKILAKLFEGIISVLYFCFFVHLLTLGSAGVLHLIVSAVMVLLAGGFAYKSLVGYADGRRRLWAILSALAGGFWIFNFFRYIGVVQWPLGYAPDLAGYARLLYFHFVLSITVLVPVLMIGRMAGPSEMILWGKWKKELFSLPARPVLVLSSVGLWLWALYVILFTEMNACGAMTGFIAICLLKAVLTGATEEICYRGIIQPAAIGYFGIWPGIILQSCLYTAFHLHLGAAFSLSRFGFLGAVMALGLVFGVVTRLTSGIGWACVVHTAINVVIEWQNLS